LLNRAVNGLPAKDRDAIVLRYLQGMSLAEVGGAMGVSEGAAKVRVFRALEKLRARFARRGVDLSPEALSVTLLTHALQTAPATMAKLAAATAQTALAGSLNLLTSTSAAVSIARGALHMIRLSALKVPLIVTAVAASIVVSSYVVVAQVASRNPTATTSPTTIPTAAAQTAGATISGNPSALPNLHLKLGWNNQSYDVPPPAMLPDAMRQSREFRDWESVGDARTLAWNAPDGSRYVADCVGRVRDAASNRISPLIPHLSRFRPDGTLEIATNNSVGLAPADWTLFAPDGKTKVLRVTNRLNGLPGTPFIQYVEFYTPDGTAVARKYQANSLGVVYLEWFYKPNGDIDHWNGTSALDKAPR
jgi:hypothetical protein